MKTFIAGMVFTLVLEGILVTFMAAEKLKEVIESNE